MTVSTPSAPPKDTNGLVAAIQRNKDAGSLGQYLESYRWSVMGEYVRPSVLQRGHLLIAQGDTDRKLYFIESGNLKVDIRTPGGLVPLAILGPGNIVGEGSFFSKQVRSASVSVYSDCIVWEMTPEGFAKLSREYPNVALALAMALGAVLSTRLLDMSKRIGNT